MVARSIQQRKTKNDWYLYDISWDTGHRLYATKVSHAQYQVRDMDRETSDQVYITSSLSVLANKEDDIFSA